ncbi:KDP operon transcriptional regulatory protein KdpE [Sideroxyarcus emersonii]|uniref:KDP operon transcriptional regulatory protein KdpE n=1 Tax=Sideroxyarcus emersonii TaxID=2764705 RepID=A0AAN2BZL7_9PROT|nr:two-component system response regulator KdpE [Sideroxyarcus emersonii]BCK88315.1 KDP operon transcriptional regulatory protein KdpE [Sideroxyarcus emersonii]
MPNAATIIVVEDEAQIRRFLRTTLVSEGYQVVEAETGRQGLSDAATNKPDLIILDLGLPDMDGVEVIRGVRAWSSVPIIILSARSQEGDKISALDAGANDYLVKPFGVGELLARMRVALRQAASAANGGEEGMFTVGELRVDMVHRKVTVGSTEVHLTPIEYRLLTVLVKHAGKVLTHQLLLKEVWGPTYVERAHYLRIYMGALRHKLEQDPARPRYLLTEVGVGYRLAVM